MVHGLGPNFELTRACPENGGLITINYHCLVQDALHGPLTRYVKLRGAHAPGMPGTFSRHRLQKKPLVSDPGMYHGTCMTHVPWCISGSVTRNDGGNAPSIPGACATLNFTYLVRGPCNNKFIWPPLDFSVHHWDESDVRLLAKMNNDYFGICKFVKCFVTNRRNVVIKLAGFWK